MFGKVTYYFHLGTLIRIYLLTFALKIWTKAEEGMNKRNNLFTGAFNASIAVVGHKYRNRETLPIRSAPLSFCLF